MTDTTTLAAARKSDLATLCSFVLEDHPATGLARNPDADDDTEVYPSCAVHGAAGTYRPVLTPLALLEQLTAIAARHDRPRGQCVCELCVTLRHHGLLPGLDRTAYTAGDRDPAPTLFPEPPAPMSTWWGARLGDGQPPVRCRDEDGARALVALDPERRSLVSRQVGPWQDAE